MIQFLAASFSKRIAFGLLMIFYCNLVSARFASYEDENALRAKWNYSPDDLGKDHKLGKGNEYKSFEEFHSDFRALAGGGIDDLLVIEKEEAEYDVYSTGPSQPEMQSFQSVNNSNMVDLFSGDFSYNIPLMDVGGYPINIGYRSGISMDQDASWVGLGWNINPGTVTRNMRGLPDDFNGRSDTIAKVSSVRENKTIGVTAGAGGEWVGLPLNLSATLGIFNNNYRGWGLESGVNVSLNAGKGSKGPLSGDLSITNNSQEGLTLSPSIAVSLNTLDANANSGIAGSLTTSLPYNSRTGLKSLQLETGLRQYTNAAKNQYYSSNYSSSISFATPSYTPTISMPFTSSQFSFTGKIGNLKKVLTNTLNFSGYVSKQRIDNEDTLQTLPAFGYLNYQNGSKNNKALLDFNREKEIPYREKPAVAHIAVPSYTYDIFSITGEGTGGMFRAYRGDVGFIYDHFMKTKDASQRASIDIGVGDIAHGGIDLNVNRSYTQVGTWTNENVIGPNIAFKNSDKLYESVYFRNPGEKAINSKSFYDSIGGDDVVAIDLYQRDINSSSTIATNYLKRYSNKTYRGKIAVTPTSLVKKERDKRSQVISYLTASEANEIGFSKYIENYKVNKFPFSNCNNNFISEPSGDGTGLIAQNYGNINLTGPQEGSNHTNEVNFTSFSMNHSSRWLGRIKAPATGVYTITTETDDGIRLWINDSLFINDWRDHPPTINNASMNLVKDQFYNIRIEYYNNTGPGKAILQWSYPNQSLQVIPQKFLYSNPIPETFVVDSDSSIIKEKRINSFRKKDHISEITVLNTDGRRYVYGIPVYNLVQKEATFSVKNSNGNSTTGLVTYEPGVDNTTNNRNGKEWYYNSETVPSYAHSFLLTQIVSPDYVDVTGNGITDDDLGDAIKFNYSKVAGIQNPFQWRAPFGENSATYNEGLKTDSRDDKGNYVYGEKELWYWHSVESKSMVATFVTEDRNDLWTIGEAGQKINQHVARRLKEINLYSKADFLKNSVNAKPIKTVHFEYSYDLCKGINGEVNSGKLTLKKIWFTYNKNDKGKLNPYVFTYHNNNPGYNIKSYDKWGNYKDPLQNPGSTQSNLITNSEYPYALKDSATAATNAGAWTLTNIQLPSGGRIKVDYESDDYAYVQNRRAMEMFKVVGFGSSSDFSKAASKLYNKPFSKIFPPSDNLFAFIKVSSSVISAAEVFRKYLEGIQKLYFKLSVVMPGDRYGSGTEYIPCYADLESANSYGLFNSTTIWVKLKGVNLAGDKEGIYNPLAKAAIQFLRLNLPSKAYPGSEVGTDLDLKDAVRIVLSQVNNVKDAFISFDQLARSKTWANTLDTSRSFVRLNSPVYKKYGGGLRVKRVVTYDNWQAMTGQKEAVYGQEYDYTVIKEINGTKQRISSGVASYEPSIGSDENPFHEPIEYVEKVSPLGPVTLGYTEEPLGESFFPSAGVGYSKVRIRTVNANKPSANGYEESEFFTAYDFPTFTDRSMIDETNKKRYKPSLSNFLRINARHYLTLSQGFKIELNDMHGKVKSQATYPEADPDHPISYTRNYYKVENTTAEVQKLSNHVMVINAKGEIDTSALIGKDVELMTDFREQLSVTNGNNYNVNADFFTFALPPFFLIPSLIGLAQREENKFRSVATTKVIQRYGILDSIIHIEKGSLISTKNLLYDSETGDVLLTRTQNEFNDSLYNFSYPAHWAYEGMGMAYKNIDAQVHHVFIKGGKIVSGLTAGMDTVLFSGGDELLVSSKQQTGGTECNNLFATFPSYSKIWAINSNELSDGAKQIYFIDGNGNPFHGNDVTLKVVRSGMRNVAAQVGVVSTLSNPVKKLAGTYQLVFDASSKVLSTSTQEYKHFWQSAASCSTCPDTGCFQDTAAIVFHDSLIRICWAPSTHPDYSVYGAWLYSSFSAYTSYTTGFERTLIDPTNLFWKNTNISDSLLMGPLNRSGIWFCDSTINSQSYPTNRWVGFSDTFYLNAADTVFVGLGADNAIRVYIDGSLFREDTKFSSDGIDNFRGWHLLPKYLQAGTHTIKVDGQNSGSVASIGLEIYGNTRAQLINAHSYESLNILFSTRDIINATFPSKTYYGCPEAYSLDSANGVMFCRKTMSPISNPYKNAVIGNWRQAKSYTYYGSRAEVNPGLQTNIRSNGTFHDFKPFWKFQGGKLMPDYDTTKWVWNSEITSFNRKGFEIENKDPLGRYNAGLYGYNFSLPTAVIQNSKYRNSAFEGFEDYEFESNNCDTICGSKRHIDFNPDTKLSQEASHTGKYSLKLNPSQQLCIAANVSLNGQEDVEKLAFTIGNSCSGNPSLQSINATSSALSDFAPLTETKILISAWVKESVDCKCETYSNSEIVVGLTKNDIANNAVYTFRPKGAIVEGWQRFEDTLTITSDTKSFSLTLKAKDSTVYFDDIRIHPFNANMKSFVYHPVSLRLMAELDENNYATFYEYDDDGTLIRVKKETERGIKTIKETRSVLTKELK